MASDETRSMNESTRAPEIRLVCLTRHPSPLHPLEECETRNAAQHLDLAVRDSTTRLRMSLQVVPDISRSVSLNCREISRLALPTLVTVSVRWKAGAGQSRASFARPRQFAQGTRFSSVRSSPWQLSQSEQPLL